MILAQLDEALKAVDHASTQGMQWMFCLAMLALGLLIVAILRYFTTREDKREQKFMAHAEKELAVSEERTKAVIEHNRLLLEVYGMLKTILERSK